MRAPCRTVLAALALSAAATWPGGDAHAQWPAPAPSSRTVASPVRVDSVTVAASKDYHAGRFYLWLVGSPNRALWSTPIRVPMLDLQTYAGGLRLTGAGGGNQTKSLRFESADGVKYAFRLADKTITVMPAVWRHTVVERILQDQVSAMHPAAGVMAGPIAAASGVLHASTVLMVLPDDSMLGESREEFVGRLGMLEQVPSVPRRGPAFAGATSIIDSDSLLVLLNDAPGERVNDRSFLAARLMDIFINDNDRHAGNWKWARMGLAGDAPWEPIARDRDHAFISFDGVVMRLSRKTSPMLVEMNERPSVPSLTKPELIDARLLAGLERAVWDSVVGALRARITDSVIHEAAMAMPVEFRNGATELEATLRKRRDALPSAADQFYRLLARRVLVHGTDNADRVVVERLPDGFVSVRVESQAVAAYTRRFDARETSELLVYLHEGDDTAQVSGNVPSSIVVRIIGGNGNNLLTDASTVAGQAHPTHLYDAGLTRDVTYGPDTMFTRRPWEHTDGALAPPQRDDGAAIKPLFGFSSKRRLGIAPYFGMVRYGYAFGKRPYSSMVKLEGDYAFSYHGGSLTLSADKRREASPLHFLGFGRVSGIEMVNFNGLGNATVDSGSRSELTAVHQTQTVLRPAIGWAVSRWDVSLGPVFRQSNTDSATSPYVAANGTYGIGSFTQVGMQLEARYEWRAPPKKSDQARDRVLFAFTGTYTPAAFDARSAYTRLGVMAGTSVTLPIILRPLLVVRGGAGQLFGEFPYYDAITLGSGGPLRYMDAQRYAGDAGLYATSELRVPLASFHFLMPIRMGVLGLTEGGRVFVDGESPGGWHREYGAGVWFGRGHSVPVLTVSQTSEQGHGGVRVRFGLNF